MSSIWYSRGSGLPADFQFGDLAIIDGEQAIAVARPDGNPPFYISPSEGTVIDVEREFGFSVSAGQPCYVDNTGLFQPATAINLPGSRVVGLSISGITQGNSGQARSSGLLELQSWEVITGSQSLSPGGLYYLSSTPGQLTNTPPSSGWLVGIGQAVSQQGLLIGLRQPIKI